MGHLFYGMDTTVKFSQLKVYFSLIITDLLAKL